MYAAINVLTKNGFMLVKKDNPIDEEIINKIQRFEKMGMLGSEISILKTSIPESQVNQV